MSVSGASAVVLSGVVKHFRRKALRREYTTVKSELLRVFRRQRALVDPGVHIEALKGVDLTIRRGETVGVIGRNGSGKSTLLKLITGIYTPSAGTVQVNGRISALLDLGAGFHPDFTGRENILINGIILGMTRAQVKERTPAIIEFSELGNFIDEPVRTYSSGMFMRLAFAVATHVDPDILIVDEILAVGDEHFAHKSMQRMNEFKASGRTIVLVTHDLGTVERWCDRAVWIDGGTVRAEGPPARVIASYRGAVAVAEDQAARTGASALSSPGGALPEVSGALALPAVRLTGLTVDRAPATTCVDVEVTCQVTAPTAFELMIQIADGSGRVLAGFTLPGGAQTTGEARARLSADQVAIAPGRYKVSAQARVGGNSMGQALVSELVVGPLGEHATQRSTWSSDKPGP